MATYFKANLAEEIDNVPYIDKHIWQFTICYQTEETCSSDIGVTSTLSKCNVKQETDSRSPSKCTN